MLRERFGIWVWSRAQGHKWFDFTRTLRENLEPLLAVDVFDE